MPQETPNDARQAVVSELKRIIAEDLDVNLSIDQIDESQPLLENGLGLDSIVVVELIGHLEEAFDIEFSDADLRVDTFSSLNSLADTISGKKNGASV